MVIEKLVLGLLATLVFGSQQSEAQTLVTRFYSAKELESYASDPPFWTYQSKRVSHSKVAHWLYGNHRHVFIDIEVNAADFR